MCVQCLSEIGGLNLHEAGPSGAVTLVAGASPQNEAKYNAAFVGLFVSVIGQVCKLITPETDVAAVYQQGAQNTQEFIRHLSIFITSFLKSHITLVEQESDQTRQALGSAIQILLRISRVDDPDIFKICLEYWNLLVTDLYNAQRAYMNQHGPRLIGGANVSSGMMGAFGGANLNVEKPGLTPIGGLLGIAGLNSGLASSTNSPRLQMYLKAMQELRFVMISKMAKPEEVLIVEDENGEIIRAPMKGNNTHKQRTSIARAFRCSLCSFHYTHSFFISCFSCVSFFRY